MPPPRAPAPAATPSGSGASADDGKSMFQRVVKDSPSKSILYRELYEWVPQDLGVPMTPKTLGRTILGHGAAPGQPSAPWLEPGLLWLKVPPRLRRHRGIRLLR